MSSLSFPAWDIVWPDLRRRLTEPIETNRDPWMQIDANRHRQCLPHSDWTRLIGHVPLGQPPPAPTSSNLLGQKTDGADGADGFQAPAGFACCPHFPLFPRFPRCPSAAQMPRLCVSHACVCACPLDPETLRPIAYLKPLARSAVSGALFPPVLQQPPASSVHSQAYALSPSSFPLRVSIENSELQKAGSSS